MRPASPSNPAPPRSHKPRAFTVFAAAFVAGAAAAVAVNSVLDVRLAQAKPKVESEPIFVALRSLPQGAAVTVWDVALRDWPRAMVPTSALRASDTFSGLVLKHPLREGQPLLSIQLVEAEARPSSPVSITAISAPSSAVVRMQEADLWAPAEPTARTEAPAVPAPQAEATSPRPETARAAPDAQAPTATEQAAVPTPAKPAPLSTAPTEPFSDERPQPSPEDTVATTDVAVPTMPATDALAMPDQLATPDQLAGAADAGIGDAVTDEMLEAIEAAAVPMADSFVAPPADGVIAAPATVAATPADRDAPRPTPADTAVDSVASEPSLTPTLADPPLAQSGADTAVGTADAAGTTSVMQRPAAGSEQPPAPALTPTRVAARYLVVPESIALQADSSFSAPRQPEPQPTPRTADPTVKPLPPTNAPPVGQPTHQRASQPRRGTSAALPDNGQRPTAAPATGQQSRRSTMFPNIAAGIETIEGEMGRIRRDRAGLAEPPATTRTRPQY